MRHQDFKFAQKQAFAPRKSLMIDMKRNDKNVMKILEASGVYRENLSDMWMWERNIMIAKIVNLVFIVIAIIMFSLIIKSSIRNLTLW